LLGILPRRQEKREAMSKSVPEIIIGAPEYDAEAIEIRRSVHSKRMTLNPALHSL
jgi:hypothetical protein